MNLKPYCPYCGVIEGDCHKTFCVYREKTATELLMKQREAKSRREWEALEGRVKAWSTEMLSDTLKYGTAIIQTRVHQDDIFAKPYKQTKPEERKMQITITSGDEGYKVSTGGKDFLKSCLNGAMLKAQAIFEQEEADKREAARVAREALKKQAAIKAAEAKLTEVRGY